MIVRCGRGSVFSSDGRSRIGLLQLLYRFQLLALVDIRIHRDRWGFARAVQLVREGMAWSQAAGDPEDIVLRAAERPAAEACHLAVFSDLMRLRRRCLDMPPRAVGCLELDAEEKHRLLAKLKPLHQAVLAKADLPYAMASRHAEDTLAQLFLDAAR
mmetsp:Transcript_12341/g.27488  ORF Transcript_12341/g.27488 Transcript_12341/m.27488 type:complete len:157 (+) Transcript_12341:1522-1992(+)